MDEREPMEREPMPGEAEYAQARQMTRHAVPSFETDAEYLGLLARSASLGYSRAQAKLGDYALRRGFCVEAYYWLHLARQGGMREVAQLMRNIRRDWAQAGFPSERSNRHELFSDAEAATGLALLDLASGRNRARAQAYLAAAFGAVTC